MTEGLVGEAREIYTAEEKYDLTAIHLLPPEKVERYHHIRSSLLQGIAKVDDLIISMDLEDVYSGLPTKVMAAKVKFIEKHLKAARSATFAENAFLEIEVAIVAMRQLMKTVAKAQSGN